MSQPEKKPNIFVYALMVCVVCSLTLTLVAQGLQSRKELNVALDKKKNILKAVGLKNPLSGKAKPEEVLAVFEDKITEIVVDADGNEIVEKTSEDIKEGDELYPLYIYRENGEVASYAFPIVGKGLWSTLYGYFAIGPDAITVKGITFYSHGETPGLGGEIEKDWFQDNFKGKKIWDMKTEELKPVEVVKGKAAEAAPKELDYHVDGISGATITSRGVTEMIEREVKKYEPYLSRVRNKHNRS